MKYDFIAGQMVVLHHATQPRKLRVIRSADGGLVDIAETKSTACFHFDLEGNPAGRKAKWSQNTITPATPKDIAEIEAEVKARQTADAAEKARIESDPRIAASALKFIRRMIKESR